MVDGNDEDDENRNFTISTNDVAEIETRGAEDEHAVPHVSAPLLPCRPDTGTNMGGTQFGKYYIPEECIFYRTKLSVAFVNLRPIVPSHVLVIPIIESSNTINPNKTHLCDLSDDEYDDLWRTVRFVQSILQHHFHENYKDVTNLPMTMTASSTPRRLSYNVAVQDGKEAGQSVFHAHVHILPRMANDFERNDDVYEALDRWEPREPSNSGTIRSNQSTVHQLQVPSDEERKDRTMIEMSTEATMYREIVIAMQQQKRYNNC